MKTTMPVAPGPPKAPPKPDTLPHKPAKLVHLARSPQATDGPPVGATAVNASDGDEYPYGLELNLEQDALEKLGMDKAPPSPGSTVHATVKMHVGSSRMSPGGKRPSLGLTVTHMAVHHKPATKVKRAAPKAAAVHPSAGPAKTVKVMAHVRRAKGAAPAPPVHVPVVKAPTAHRVTRAR